MIAHKNLRKYFFIPALIAGLVIPTQATAAPKAIAIKPIVKWGESADIELLATTAEAVVSVKNTTSNSSNIEIQARDFAGTSLWTKIIDSGADEVATAIAADNQGNIWLAGNSAAIAIADTTTATSGALNPDDVVSESVALARQDMRQLTLWKISKTGEVSETFSTIPTEISIVEAISVSATGLSMIAARESGSFVISTNLKGVFSKELKIGTAKTKLNSIVRSGDGSINVFGSSAETLLGKK